jgi:NTP pyrophosphatase (non-canonical NTP hydrolase)
MRSVNDYLLCCLSEEAAEISQIVAKIQRFGRGSVWEGKSGAERLKGEINDLLGVLELLAETRAFDVSADRVLIDTKKAKVKKYMKVSQDLGLLDGPL